jgi:hypothetical protein
LSSPSLISLPSVRNAHADAATPIQTRRTLTSMCLANEENVGGLPSKQECAKGKDDQTGMTEQ